MASGKKGLGGGLSNLFGDTTVVDLKTETSADSVSKIAVSRIEPNPGQPRKVFAQEALDELLQKASVCTASSRRSRCVRAKKEGYYQIIAGERRWRAARQAGLDEIPAMVIEASESEVMELALIENLQRQDLNPIEEAEGYEQLMRDYGLTQEQVAQRVVKSRPAVANALRLLQLPGEVRTMVSRGELSGGHARAVLAVAEEDKRVEAAKQMAGMTVRQAEALAKRMNKKPAEPKPQESDFSVDYIAALEKELESVLGRKICIQQGKNSGQLTLEYYGADDLERLTEGAARPARIRRQHMNEQKNNAPEQAKPEKKLSRTTLTFYIVGLFSVAIALILISYVAQARADRQVENLSSQLNEQQTVAQGATQKVADLQQQFDLQSSALESVRSTLGTEQAKTDVVGATQNLRDREQMLEMLVAAEQAVIDDDMEQLNYLLEGIRDAFSEDKLKLREDGGVLEANDYAVYQKLLALADSAAQSEDKNVNNQ